MRLPKKMLWPTDTGELGGWGHYLHHGFEQLGIPVENCPRLKKDAEERVFGKLRVRGTQSFELVYDGQTRRIWYDIGCFPKHHGYETLMEEDDLYFKIRMDSRHERYPRMFPIGNRVQRPDRFFAIFPALRNASTSNKYEYDIISIFRNNQIARQKAVQFTLEHGWKTEAWVTPHKGRPHPPSVPHRGFKFEYEDYLMKQAHTKIGLALPGVGDLTFRQMEIMAMGRPCMITEPTTTPMADGHDCWIEVKPDMSDFVYKVAYYLEHEEEREEIGRKGQAFWEQYYSPKGQAEHVLRIVEENP